MVLDNVIPTTPSQPLQVGGGVAQRRSLPIHLLPPPFVRRSLVIAALLVLWQCASLFGWVNVQTLASPAEVWAAGVRLWQSGDLLPGILVSLRRVAIGLAIGVSIGGLLGLVAGISRLGEEVIDAPLQILRALPFLGLLPLLIVWLGIGEGIKIGLVAIGVIFPIYLNLYKGIRAVDRRYAELAQTCGVGWRGLLRWIILPGAWPAFLVGLRFSLGIAWLSLVVTEAVNAEAGIGYLIQQGQQFLETDVIVLGLVIYALLGLVMEALVRVIEWRTLRWRVEFTSA
ncbi:ABC transporter permease [Bradyrhizobium sp. U87765 SZCCT0131]|uniref:ABC transporter permease n=1 Tax=unclassified Bradyrhizobium TaxID=2631580 RepID=UPI001BAB28B0|nr:ABC transporter permease [Bradyrhizobium sp. U87765 SZCCT0131]MBR1262726.1 ABC transporter permease [Bradyrhizobium sp. U87765 SZCCT0134]MBR1308802.1 ABC transporter permease [Bradyrhizobium sp. U87765 SZCCT0110]MBR1318508.1 ABC transporter permease [Bradyrhizobium sp. U87765 SZCCT0109]MBR1352212.1 ABC transporter permease [Bradyrhizobium sp. U87765 SZCCT0048]